MLTPEDRELAQALIREKAVSLEALHACRCEIERLARTDDAAPRLGELLVRRHAVTSQVLSRVQRRLRPSTESGRRPAPGRPEARRRRRRRTLGGYELLAPIASGGSGTVFKGQDPVTGALVAIKVLSAAGAQSRGTERFLREAQVACQLQHPNLVRGLTVGREDGLYFFVMELVQGQSVGDLLRRIGRFEELQAVRIARAVCSALECARRHAIVHRDIKPDNILIESGGLVKLCDLGLARPFGRPTTVTTTGIAVGTPRYISPEQARGDQNVDHRSDLYSLGVTLFHMVVGYPPFDGETGMVILSKHIYEEVPPVRARRPHLSPELEFVALRATRKNAADRYETAGDMERDLARVEAQLAAR
jgi:serine/threonine-protein kinase